MKSDWLILHLCWGGCMCFLFFMLLWFDRISFYVWKECSDCTMCFFYVVSYHVLYFWNDNFRAFLWLKTYVFVTERGVVSAKIAAAKKQHLGDMVWMLCPVLFVFRTSLVRKTNYFGCLKLVNCLQFGFLPASIVSKIAYTLVSL